MRQREENGLNVLIVTDVSSKCDSESSDFIIIQFIVFYYYQNNIKLLLLLLSKQ